MRTITTSRGSSEGTIFLHMCRIHCGLNSLSWWVKWSCNIQRSIAISTDPKHPGVWNNISRSLTKNSVFMHEQCQLLQNHKALHVVCFLWLFWQGSISEVSAEVSGNFRDKVTYINICTIAPALQKPTERTIFKVRYHMNLWRLSFSYDLKQIWV